MEGGWDLLLDLLVTLSSALFLGILFEKLRQSAVVGYLIAGVIVGPSAAAWVRNADQVGKLAELGVALLLFTIGLEFSWRRLVRLGPVAFVGGGLQIALVLLAVMGIAMALGVPLQGAFALGAVASLASTAVVLRLLKDHNDLDSGHGKSAIGILLAQDIAVVPLVMTITLMGGISSAKGGGGVGQTLMNAVLLVAALVLLVSLVLPRLLDAKTVAKNRELPILIAIATCFSATWGAHAAGLSAALGAFLAGMLLADTPFADQIRSDVNPLKTLFLTLFFASIGMVLDVTFVVQNAGLVMGTLVGIMLLKAALTAAACKPFVPSIVSCTAVGILLAQIGEFSFVLADLAHESKLITSFHFQLVIAVSVLSLILTPYLVVNAAPWARWLAIRIIPTRALAQSERVPSEALAGHVILVGFGEAGQRAAEFLGEQHLTVLVMEVNPRLVTLAKQRGYRGMVADATQSSNLLHAHLLGAACLVIATPEPITGGMIAGVAKSVAPEVPVVIRARYHIMAEELNIKGADLVVDEETVVGEQLGAKALICAGRLAPKEEAPAGDAAAEAHSSR